MPSDSILTDRSLRTRRDGSLNLVEIFSSITTRQAIRRGTFTSVPDLITAIRTFIDSAGVLGDAPQHFTLVNYRVLFVWPVYTEIVRRLDRRAVVRVDEVATAAAGNRL
jgi:hypothetical protein